MTYEPRAWVGHHIANRKGWGTYVDLQLELRRQDAALAAQVALRGRALISERTHGDSRNSRPCNAETSESA